VCSLLCWGFRVWSKPRITCGWVGWAYKVPLFHLNPLPYAPRSCSARMWEDMKEWLEMEGD
jgi:hypothetical protein